jgi:phosphohistidine phosphatase
MKTLYIVRHAKSSWDNPGLKDEERPLLESGRDKTRLVIHYLVEKLITVDKIISSHAVRAYETAKMFAESLQYPADQIEVNENLYMGNTDEMIEMLLKLQDDIASVMVVGHNPEMTDFANQFLKDEIDTLPTSGVVCVEFKTDYWVEILDAKKKTKFVIYPKLFT